MQALSSKACVSNAAVFTGKRQGATSRGQLQVMNVSIKEVRDRIGSVSNTKKITEAMKLVAAAKVRRAQEAVVNGRPFAENLVKVLYGVNQRLRVEDVDSPLVAQRPVKSVALVVVCDINGNCVDAADDEVFKLTTREGQLVVEAEQVRTETADFDAGLIFEQDPVQIVDALLPLYMNASLLRSLQEALASELAARMNAMNNASDNAGELKRSLTLVMNRKRQAKITTELTEIVAGASSV
ncbi:hypothetical protein CHLNCDRAFT_145385 [Chlorella variabilis]|uniref:F-ATPase gamma subunit n=1 Tax=Chlorella variabilis TaxID=554065 RepID=E1ZEB1_CHLVA|nr:hypothetical protein CHLNCDRAFT_145385 [Chlorella variabilis]EFN55840.1 hypothetical protein CHLNCDRAFT_145385 [Chlorella variabilis]|eukprot:XP_005847942.1 hypothetical protein CHLNCDRAFT_145385 [Chlorella variabilis]